MHKVKVLCGAAILAGCLAPAAHADEWTKLTYFTFSAPVELPGMSLPAGTYRFELADPDDSRRVVRVSEKDGSKVHGTFLSIPNQMLEPAAKPLVMFKETPAGAPEAVKAWFYPGETTGYEFVYPHDQALKIAKANHSPVMTAKGAVTGTTTASDTARVDENDRMQSADERLKESTSKRSTTTASTATTTSPSTTTAAAAAASPKSTTAPAPTTAPQTTTAQAVRPPATVAPQPVTTPRGTTIPETTTVGTSGKASKRNLPATGSLLPLMELLSGLSLAGGMAFRTVRKSEG